MHRGLWVLQILVGTFMALASGAPKLILPLIGAADDLPMPIPIPLWFLVFIGVAELAGGLALLIVPPLRLYPMLVPLAAAGLALVALGGTVYQLLAGAPENAVFAVVIAGLCAIVAYGRWRVAPHGRRRTPSVRLAAAAR